MLSRLANAFAATILAIRLIPCLDAQTLGEITGVVADSGGGVLVGSVVTVTNPQTGLTRQTATNDTGIYNFPALQPGTYNVRAEMRGFTAEVRNGVELQVQQTARIDFQLKVGDTTQTVEVSGAAALLATENATVGTVIENRRIVELPMNGRNFISLIALSPNVTAGFGNGATPTARQGGDRATQAVSIAGQRREFTYFTLDGISNTDVNFGSYILLPSIDVIQEFKVQSGVYSAEFGREPNQVNVSTKGGTNEYHGALFEFLRNSVMDARPYAFTSNPPARYPFKWNQYGFTLGGPLSIPRVFNGKNRLLFSTNYEGYRVRRQAQTVISTVPGPFRTGDFSSLLPGTVIRDWRTGAPYPGNIIPANQQSKAAQTLLLYDPLPNVPGATLTNNNLNLTRNLIDKDQFTARIDYVENEKSSWFGRYSRQVEHLVTPFIDQAGTNLDAQISQVVISNTRLISPTLVNELRAGYNGYHNNYATLLQNKTNVNEQAGLSLLTPIPAYAWGVPQVGLTGYTAWGDNIEGPYTTHNHTFQLMDTLSWTKGAHSLKFGGEVRRDRYNQTGNTYIRGAFATQNQATGYAAADYLLGYINTLSLAPAGAAVAQFRSASQYYFVDDTWKIRSNLTLNVGLRYEYSQPWQSKNNGLMNPILPCYNEGQAQVATDCHPILVRVGEGTDFYNGASIRFDPRIRVAVNNGLIGGGRSLVEPDRNNFAPRVGLAWSPTSKWTVRLGGGFFFVIDQGNALFELTRNIAGRVQSTANLIAHDLTLEHPIANTGVCGTLPPGVACVTTPQFAANDIHQRTGYIFEYVANIQRQLSQSTVLEVGYIGSNGHKFGRYVNYNVPIPSPVGTILSRTPYQELALVLLTTYNVNSNYNSLSVKLTRRAATGLTLLSGFTYARGLDNGSALRGPGALGQNSFCISCEYGPSDFHNKFRVVTSALYQIPLGKGHRYFSQGIGNIVLGGWQIGGINNFSTGFPISFATGTDRTNTAAAGSTGTRPNATGEPINLDNPTTQRWFNIGALAYQPLGTFGNLGRNTGIGPGIFSLDFSSMKNFNFGESRALQFRFEAFNVLNHPNWGDPATTMTGNRVDAVTGRAIPDTGNFGVISSTRTPMREIQLSLKFLF